MVSINLMVLEVLTFSTLDCNCALGGVWLNYISEAFEYEWLVTLRSPVTGILKISTTLLFSVLYSKDTGEIVLNKNQVLLYSIMSLSEEQLSINNENSGLS